MSGGIGFTLTDEQQALRQLARDFARAELRPRAADAARPDAQPDRELLARAAAVGLTSFQIPAAFGGGGMDATTSAIINEELAWGDAGLSTLLGSGHLFSGGVLATDASDTQKRRWLSIITRDEGAFGAIAFSEPGAGSDVASMQTRAERDGDRWVLSGEKTWITGGGVADATLVYARTGGAGAAGISAFVVLPDDDGFSHQRLRLAGVRSSYTSSLFFDGVRLPADRMLGSAGTGFAGAMGFFMRSRPQVAASAIGVARAAFEYAVEYARERTAFGKPIIHNQGVSFQLAEIGMRIEAARLLVWKACRIVDAGEDAGLAGSYAKALAADVAMAATTTAVQVLGGAGLSDDHPVGRWMNDAKVLQIVEGTSEIQRLIASRYLSLGQTTLAEA